MNNTNPATAKEKRSTPSEPQASNPRAICIGKCLISILIIIVLTYTTFCTAAIDRLYAEEDTRDIAARWIGSNIPHGSSIGLATIPWFYTPPLDPEMALPLVANERYSRALGFKEYLLVVNDEKEWNPSFLEQEMPQYVILSEFEYTDRLRIKDNDTLKYFDILNRDYILEKRFDRDLMLAGMKFPLWADLPHDMSYASPEILIYGRIPALPITKVNIGIIEDTESDNAPTPPAADTRIPEAP